jgi:predicted aspartyl protease
MRRLAGVAAALAGLALAGRAEAACHLKQLAELTVTMRGTKPLVQAKINGRDVTLVLDTGANYSTVTPEIAARLGLRDIGFAGKTRGIGGAADHHFAQADSFTVGDLAFDRLDFGVTDAKLAADGLLGENILGAVDIEIDLANGVARLFRPDGCLRQNLGYWADGKALEVPLEHSARFDPGRDRTRHIMALANVNGQRIHAIMDTGASRSGLTLAAAAKAGLTPKGPGVQYAGLSHGIGPREVETWRGPVKLFALGGEQIQNTDLRFGDFDLQHEADMLLGADFFMSHRVYIANSQDKAFITYNGGPVFQLEEAEADARGHVAASAPAPAP